MSRDELFAAQSRFSAYGPLFVVLFHLALHSLSLNPPSSSVPGINLVVFGASEPGSQADHLRSFSNADVIVGPHGAGLTNALTSWPGSVMIEFIPDSGLSEWPHHIPLTLDGWEGGCRGLTKPSLCIF